MVIKGYRWRLFWAIGIEPFQCFQRCIQAINAAVKAKEDPDEEDPVAPAKTVPQPNSQQNKAQGWHGRGKSQLGNPGQKTDIFQDHTSKLIRNYYYMGKAGNIQLKFVNIQKIMHDRPQRENNILWFAP